MNVTNNANEQNVVILVQIFSQSLCDNTETHRDDILSSLDTFIAYDGCLCM